MMKGFLDRLGVCSWSLQPATAAELIERIQATGIPRAQIALDPIRRDAANWDRVGEQFAQAGLSLVSGMIECAGEDYSTMEAIRRTGGLLPDETWQDNWENIQANAAVAGQLGLKLVTLHAGFLPHDESDPSFEKLQHRLRLIADLFASKGIDLAFETGQETALTLKYFLEKLGRINVGVNFDPANMLLYDQGNPIEALEDLGPWLKQCHVKDAIRTPTPGTWGQEVVVGTGEVNWVAFFQTLEKLKFPGFCCLEREHGTQRVEDIRAGRQYLEGMGR